MYTLLVNGTSVTVEEDLKLIDVLRNDLGLKSVKDGCSEGACGTCTVLIDGKATKACVQKVSKMEGKSIVTVEGLSDREKKYLSMPLEKREPCSAASASPAWLCAQRD